MGLLTFLAKQGLRDPSLQVHVLTFLSVLLPSPALPAPGSVLAEITVPKILSYELCENRRWHRMIALNVLTERLNIYCGSVKLHMRKSLESRWCLFCCSRNCFFLMG